MVEPLLSAVARWATNEPDVYGVLLVGSHARGSARQDSDIDVVLLTSQPERYLSDTSWAAAFGDVRREKVENWGRLTSLRVWYADGREVEYGLTTPDWAALPLDQGTERVVSDGVKVIFDRGGTLRATLGNRHSNFMPGRS